MVERVARALWVDYWDGDACAWEDADDGARETSRSLARAALKSMASPTDAMVVAGDERIISALEIREMIAATPTPAEKCFAAMIGAALEETP